MSKKNIKIFSKTDNLRLYVIEHSLHIETLIAEAIGSILDIDYKNSKSFGFSSSALSFNQKIYIVQDIKGLESEMATKLTCLMNIRNKFAHVQEIDSFEKLFELANNGTQIKNQLIRWYDIENKNDEDEKYKYLFFCLSEEITQMLFLMQVEEKTKKGVLEIEKKFQKSNLEAYKEVVSKSENYEKINREVWEKTIEKLPNLGIYKK